MGDSVDERDFFVNLPIHMDAKKTLKYVVLTVVMVNLALIAVVLLGTKTPPRQPMPNPNGYDDFVRAGQQLTGSAFNYYLASNQPALADFVSRNQDALKLVHQGLGHKCRAPNNYSPNYIRRMGQELPSFRQLEHLLCAEGKLAEMQGRTDDAINSYLSCISFGESFAKDGVIVVKLVGIASEYEPRRRLRSLLQNVDGSKCREIALKLDALNADEEPLERNLKEERAWAKASLTWREQFEELFQYRRERDDFVPRFQANRLEGIKLAIAFAERAYELDKGKKPQNIADLVPNYLKSIPIDPFTGTNIAYLPK